MVSDTNSAVFVVVCYVCVWVCVYVSGGVSSSSACRGRAEQGTFSGSSRRWNEWRRGSGPFSEHCQGALEQGSEAPDAQAPPGQAPPSVRQEVKKEGAVVAVVVGEQ